MSDRRSILKHSFNYLLANVATKALAFVAIPVYTRLLSVEEYGIVNVFISLIGIVSVLLTLNTEVAINRFYFDSKNEDEFKEFVGTTLRVNLTICIITSLVFILCSGWISNLLGISRLLVLSLIPVSLYSVSNNIFQQIYNPQLKSRKIAVVTSVQQYLAFGFSILIICLFKSEKYYGYVLGMILAMILTGSYMWKQISKYYKSCFRREFVKYILSYSLPFVLYSLSNVILTGFSRIFLGGGSGYALAGAYGLATNLAVMVDMIIMITHSAWNPYYYRYMNNKDYNSIDDDYKIIWRITLVAAIALSLFGTELGLILSKKEFLEALYVLPILALGYSFHQWAYVYIRNTSYSKKTIWNALCVLLSGIVNVVLNVILIPSYNYFGAALATMISYVALAVFCMTANQLFIKCYTPSVRVFIVPLLISLPFFFFSITLYEEQPSFAVGRFIIKLIILFVFSTLMMYQYRNKLKSMVSMIANRKGIS